MYLSFHNDGLLPVMISGLSFHYDSFNGKVVLSVGAALRESFFCPRVVPGLSSFVLSVFLLSLQCCRDALVMS